MSRRCSAMRMGSLRPASLDEATRERMENNDAIVESAVNDRYPIVQDDYDGKPCLPAAAAATTTTTACVLYPQEIIDHATTDSDFDQKKKLRRRCSMTSTASSGSCTMTAMSTTPLGNCSGKAGRKGDPRMHRAVSARVANPKISLFDALLLGGFHYQDDEDANAMDTERVTLGQRKNQLSRRIRLTLKHQQQQQQQGGRHHSVTCSTPFISLLKSVKHDERCKSVFNKQHPFLKLEPTPLSEDQDSAIPFTVTNSDTTFMPDNSYGSMISTSSNISDPIPSPNNAYHGRLQTISDCSITARNTTTTTTNATTMDLCHVNANRDNAHSNSAFANSNGLANNNGPGTTVDDSLNNTISFSHSFKDQPYVAPAENISHSDIRNASSSSIATADSNQEHQHGPPVSELAAVSSLMQTAASVGLTLDQLASTLRSDANLVKTLGVMSSPQQSQQQHDLAVSLYQCENRALYSRAMLLAGYSPEVAHNEQSSQHVQVAMTSWQLEGQRLQAIVSIQKSSSSPSLPLQTAVAAAAAAAAAAISLSNAVSPLPPAETAGECNELPNGAIQCRTPHHQIDNHHHSEHGINHHHRVQKDGIVLPVATSMPEKRSNFCAAHDSSSSISSQRHIHRLGGKCGHVPILHQPIGGLPHIDFVVGDRVECYQGVQQPASQELLWPSSYRCEDLLCPDPCHDDATQKKLNEHEHPPNANRPTAGSISELSVGCDPKIFDLNDLDLDGEEWNLDVANGDSLLGLFKLSEQ